MIFVADRGAAKHAKQWGSVIQRIPPKSLIPQADAQLGLGGELIRYMQGRPLTFEDAPEMDDSHWETMLNARFPARKWKRWFGSTPSAIYSVVVVLSPAQADGAELLANAPQKCLALFVLGGSPLWSELPRLRSWPLSRRSGRSSALPYPPLRPRVLVIHVWWSGNRFGGGPVLLSAGASFLQLLIALFEDHRPHPIQLVGRSEVFDRRVSPSSSEQRKEKVPPTLMWDTSTCQCSCDWSGCTKPEPFLEGF